MYTKIFLFIFLDCRHLLQFIKTVLKLRLQKISIFEKVVIFFYHIKYLKIYLQVTKVTVIKKKTLYKALNKKQKK